MVTEFKGSFVFPVNRSTGNFRLCQLCNGSVVHGSLRQHGKGNQMVNTPQLSMFIVTIEGEIVDVNVSLNQVVRQQFSRTSSGITLNFQRPGFLIQTGLSFVSLMWLVIGNSEGKEVLFQAITLWNHVTLWNHIIFSMSS